MKTNKEQRPYYLLTKGEAKDFSFKEKKESAGTCIRFGKKVDVFDYQNELSKFLVFKDEKEALSSGFFTDYTAGMCDVQLNKKDTPTAYFLNEAGEIKPLVDKSIDEVFLKIKPFINPSQEEIKNSELPVLTIAFIPKHYVSLRQAMRYHYENLTPCAIRLEGGKRKKIYSYLFSIEKEMKKPHFQRRAQHSIGLLTKGEMRFHNISFKEKEEPVAYLGSEGYAIGKLYDRGNHPKYRLKKVTGGEKNDYL